MKNIFQKIINKFIKKEILEQIVYDVFYGEICPICEEWIVHKEHYSEERIFTEKSLIECQKCHVAVYGNKKRVGKILKKYIKNDKEPMGLKLISEETIP